MQYKITGEPFPVVIAGLESGESIVCQKGGMSWMSPNMQMQTVTGGLGQMFSKALSRESIFQNVYTANGGAGEIAFCVNVPGQILAIPISAQKTIVAQKSSYLASQPSVELKVFFQRNLGAGLFGGEGFVMQQFTGEGMVFLEFGGSIIEYDLGAGQSMLVNTGTLAAMDATCSIDIESVKGVTNKLFGGEGFFNTRVTGPGHIWLQTLPLSSLASTIAAYIPRS